MTDAAVLEIRTAEPADAEELAELIVAAYGCADEGHGWTSDSALVRVASTDAPGVRRLIDEPGSVVVVGEQEGRLVGCCHVRRVGSITAQVGLLAVDPDLQSHGIARRLGTAALDHALWQLGCRRAEIEVLGHHVALRDWYASEGFRETGETRPLPRGVALIDGLQLVTMRKDLRP